MTEDRPQRIKPRITAAPKLRQIYWCEFWKDAQLPEMWKTRPVIIISYKNTLHGTCLVIPTSTANQVENKWAHQLSVSIEGDGVVSWAICNHLSTIATSRLKQFNQGVTLLPKEDFNQILDIVMKWLPEPFFVEN